MEKEKHHIIQGFQVEINVSNKRIGQAAADQTQYIMKNKIIPITEKVLDEWSDENTHIQLDRLEIDLGAIPFDDLAHEMPDLFETKIKETLKSLFSQRQKIEEESLVHVEYPQVLLDQLIFFLQKGHFPWHLHVAYKDPDEMVLKLLNDDSSQLIKQLKPLLISDDVLNRLVRSLHSDTVDLFLAEIAFSDAATQAMLLIGELARFNHMQNIHLSRKQIEAVVYRQAIKRAALGQIVFTGKSVAKTVSELLSFFNYDRKQIPGYVRQFSMFAKSERFLTQFVDVIDELKKQGKLDELDRPDPAIDESRKKRKTDKKVAEQEQGKEQVEDSMICNLDNAGLVLLYPYLKHLFERLNWMENNQFINENRRAQAVLLTDYLVYGEQNFVSEHRLGLNKILCGMQIQEAIDPLVEIGEQEKEEADELLISAIKHWSTLKNTSADGYRYSFLKRDGVLKFVNESWQLNVERKSYDMLMESLPFTIGIIQLPWMNHKLKVEW
ncbi:contractile injection system tape measure protein [Sunxiuqinia indica]|uniref:contractile injection system tape measure protein n=1 Tax=Sunxiuqinia indica TaxID=2692584 RepID=UPI001359AD3F|nr:contractile injection system tape measure protein [Sunxiuqinia indica]